MLKCINAGAADYLLKPLRLDVIKTLFLVGDTFWHHPYQQDSNTHPSFSLSAESCPPKSGRQEYCITCDHEYERHTNHTHDSRR